MWVLYLFAHQTDRRESSNHQSGGGERGPILVNNCWWEVMGLRSRWVDFNSVNVRNSPLLQTAVWCQPANLPVPDIPCLVHFICLLYLVGEKDQQLCYMMNVFDSYNYLWFQTIILQSGPLFYTTKCTRKATFHLFLSCSWCNISLSIKFRTNQFSFPFGFHGYT